MAYEKFDINDIRGEEASNPSMVQRVLLTLFPREVAKAIYNFGINTVGLLAKIGLVLILPFKFFQFWIESYKEIREHDKQNKAE